MPTDVTKVDPKQYWAELRNATKGGRRSWAKRGAWRKEALPEVTFTVDRWKEVDALGAKQSLDAVLTLYDIDSTEQLKGSKGDPKADTVFGRVKLKLTKLEDGSIAASIVKKGEMLELKKEERLEDFYLKDTKDNVGKADFAVRIGANRILYRLGRADLHDELANGGVEIGFTLEEGGEAGRIYKGLPPLSPTFIDVSEPIADMLALPDRFSDPGRKPPLATDVAATKHEEETLKLMKAGADVDVDGLRFEKLLDGSMSRRQFIEKMLQTKGFSMTSKTYELFDGQKDPWLDDPKKDVLSQEWTSGDIVKAFFVIHDIGILSNNRKYVHYQADTRSIRFKAKKGTSGDTKADVYPTAVHGFLNWSGVYAPAWNFYRDKRGTKNSFGGNPDPAWAPFTLEHETHPIPFYRPGPNDLSKALAELGDPGSKYFDNIPPKMPKGMDKSEAPQEFNWSCLTWTHAFEGWGDRRKVGKAACKPDPKKGEKVIFFAGSPEPFLLGLVDLYLLASARAGHLLTITTHNEVDRSIHGGHDDPAGIELQALYDLITERISKTGKQKLPGLGGLDVPVGVRYGQHPRRHSAEPIRWKGIPVARLYAGSSGLKFPTKFPQQSSLPTKK
jgi:hypothetical protein